MPYLFCSQRLGGRTLRSGSVDKPVMGAFCAGSYEVTPPGRLRATTSSAGPTDRPKDSSTRQAYGESDPAEDVSHILTGLRPGLGSLMFVSADVDTRPVGSKDVPDLARLFESQRTTRRCWCMAFCVTRSQFAAGWLNGGNQRRFGAMAAASSTAMGILGFAGC
jgi:hypothetical protein